MARTVFRTNLVCLLAVVSAFACARVPRLGSASGEIGPSFKASPATLAPGTAISARLDRTVDAASARPGERFTASVSEPIVAPNGRTLIPLGATLFGHVAEVGGTARPEARSTVRLGIDSLMVFGFRYPIAATIESATSADSSSGAATTSSTEIASAGGLSAADSTTVTASARARAETGRESGRSIQRGATLVLRLSRPLVLR